MNLSVYYFKYKNIYVLHCIIKFNRLVFIDIAEICFEASLFSITVITSYNHFKYYLFSFYS